MSGDYFDLRRVNGVFHFQSTKDKNGRTIDLGDRVRLVIPPVIYGDVVDITAPSEFSEKQVVHVSVRLNTLQTVNNNITLDRKVIK